MEAYHDSLSPALLPASSRKGQGVCGQGCCEVTKPDLSGRFAILSAKPRLCIRQDEAGCIVEPFPNKFLAEEAVAVSIGSIAELRKDRKVWFLDTDRCSSRMLKKSASFVLASLRGSTYGKEYASPLRSLRPRWTAFLNILRAIPIASAILCGPVFGGVQNSFSTAC